MRQLPDGWEGKHLADVCDIDKVQNQHKNLPYVGMEDIGSATAEFIGSMEPKRVKSSTFKFTNQHILYGRLRPYLNKVLAPEFQGHCSTEIFPIKPKSKLSREYLLFWFLKDSTVNEINATCTGTRMPRANMKEVMGFNFPLPSLPEQQRIVVILDEAFAGISSAVANAAKNLANARELFESYLNGVFTRKGEGWVEKRLEELGMITSSKRIFKREYCDTGIPFYRTKEVKEKAHGRDITTELFISKDRYNEIKQNFGVPQKGDILLTAIGTIGESFVVNGQEDFYFKDGNVLWLKDFSAVNSYFLRYVLMSFVENLKRLSHGSAYNALPIEKLKTHIIHLPSTDEQKQIVKQLDTLQANTQHLESIYQQKLIALAELKQSILQKAFAGELTRGH